MRLSPNAKPGEVKFAISQYRGLKIVEGNSVLISSRQQLHTLFFGIAAFTTLLLVALLILAALMFFANYKNDIARWVCCVQWARDPAKSCR